MIYLTPQINANKRNLSTNKNIATNNNINFSGKAPLSEFGESIKKSLKLLMDKSQANQKSLIQAVIDAPKDSRIDKIAFTIAPADEEKILYCKAMSGNSGKTFGIKQGRQWEIRKYVENDENINDIEKRILGTVKELEEKDFSTKKIPYVNYHLNKISAS